MAPFSSKLNAAGDFWTLKASDDVSEPRTEDSGEIKDPQIEEGSAQPERKWRPKKHINNYRYMYKKNDTEQIKTTAAGKQAQERS